MGEMTESQQSWLPDFPGLAGIDDEAGRAALRAATVHQFRAGTEIVRAGDPCQSFILVSRGTLRVYESDQGGRELVLFRVRPGDMCVLTLRHLMTATPYSAATKAEDDTEVVMIPMDRFQDALARSDAFRNFVISTLSRRMGEVMSLVEQVAFRRLDVRLAGLLERWFRQEPGTRIQKTHQDLALELGTTREVISRMLKDLERRGAIHLGRGMIECQSPELLSRLASAGLAESS